MKKLSGNSITRNAFKHFFPSYFTTLFTTTFFSVLAVTTLANYLICILTYIRSSLTLVSPYKSIINIAILVSVPVVFFLLSVMVAMKQLAATISSTKEKLSFKSVVRESVSLALPYTFTSLINGIFLTMAYSIPIAIYFVFTLLNANQALTNIVSILSAVCTFLMWTYWNFLGEFAFYKGKQRGISVLGLSRSMMKSDNWRTLSFFMITQTCFFITLIIVYFASWKTKQMFLTSEGIGSSYTLISFLLLGKMPAQLIPNLLIFVSSAILFLAIQVMNTRLMFQLYISKTSGTDRYSNQIPSVFLKVYTLGVLLVLILSIVFPRQGSELFTKLRAKKTSNNPAYITKKAVPTVPETHFSDIQITKMQKNDLQSIHDALLKYRKVKGVYPFTITLNPLLIGTNLEQPNYSIDLCKYLYPTYIKALPRDPRYANTNRLPLTAPCNEKWIEWTGYQLQLNQDDSITYTINANSTDEKQVTLK